MRENKSNPTYSLDAADRKILAALNADVRSSLTRIAKSARTSKEVVHYRIARLLERRIVKGFMTVFGLGYWSYKVLLRFQRIDEKSESAILDWLVAHPRTNFVTACSGDWDVVFAVMARDPKDLDITLRSIADRVGAHLHEMEFSASIGSHTFGHRYIMPHVKEATTTARIDKNALIFDEKDKAIAAALRTDARLPIAEIARITAIPPDTVRNRMRLMLERRVIKRYRMIIDSSQLGYQRYEVFLRFAQLSDELRANITAYGAGHNAVEYLGQYVGPWDFTLTVHVRTIPEFRRFVLDLKAAFGDRIQNITSVTLFETRKHTYLPPEIALEGKKTSPR